MKGRTANAGDCGGTENGKKETAEAVFIHSGLEKTTN